VKKIDLSRKEMDFQIINEKPETATFRRRR